MVMVIEQITRCMQVITVTRVDVMKNEKLNLDLHMSKNSRQSLIQTSILSYLFILKKINDKLYRNSVSAIETGLEEELSTRIINLEVSRSFPIISWQNEYEFFKGNNARNAVRREIITYFETKKKLIYKKMKELFMNRRIKNISY